MTIQEFQHQISRLASAFSGNGFNTERVNMIWKEVNTLPVEAMVNIVDYFIGDYKYAPMVKDFREQASMARERIWTAKKRQPLNTKPNGSCPLCHGLGRILARHRDDFSAYAFKCQCEAGRAERAPYPVWSNEREKEFVTV